MQNNHSKSSLKEILTKDVSECIDKLMNLIFISKEIINDLILIKSQFKENEKQYIINLITNDEYNRNLSRIRYATVKIIDNLNLDEGYKSIDLLEEEVKLYKEEAKYLSLIVEAKTASLKSISNSMKIWEDDHIKGIKSIFFGASPPFIKPCLSYNNDIQLLSDSLRRRIDNRQFFSLEIKTLSSAKKGQILNSIKNIFQKKSSKEYIYLIYFSGSCYQNMIVCDDSNRKNSKGKITYDNLLSLEELVQLHSNSKSNVLYIFDSNTEPDKLDFEKFSRSKVGFIFASDRGKHKVYEHKFPEGRFGVFTYFLSKCFRKYSSPIFVNFIPEIIENYMKPYSKNTHYSNKKPFFWCSDFFTMTIPGIIELR